jgi:DNA-directed RNA polymerase specialized sigma24 family protein
MTQETISPQDSQIPQPPLACGAPAFAGKASGMLDGSPKDEATVREAFAGMEEMFELIASGLYTLASMLVGEGEESVQLVETAVATADVSACEDATQARKSSRLALSKAALEVLVSRDPDGLAAPKHLEPARGCIEDDDLDAAGLASEELAKMMAGPDRDRLRTWLASLSTEARVIFVMRAVAGFSSPEVAALLAAHGGPRSAGWNADAVREIFRQALCSLASQLLHALTSR